MRFYLYLKKNMFIPLILFTLLILSLVADDITTLFPGYLDILKDKSILITDYLSVGGLNSTLFNVFTTLLINFILIKVINLRISGPIFAGIMLLTGYSFFGINTINFFPIYIGIFIFSKIKKVEFRAMIIPTLFSCGIAGLLSFIYFGIGLELYFSIPLGIIIGVLIGMIIPPLTSHVILFSKGYNLYNIGFALGILSLVAYAIFNAFDIQIIQTAPVLSTKYHLELLISLFTISAFFIINGLVNYKECFVNYKKMLKRSGRLLQDFIRDYSHDAVCFNIGINLLLCTIIVVIFKIEITGPLIASLFAVVGFSAMGKHIKNIYPVIIGALLATFVTQADINSISVQMGIFFVTALAPLSGRYGLIIGLIAGFIHIIISPMVLQAQGPFNLYLNGFIGGFVASLLISIVESYEKELTHDN